MLEEFDKLAIYLNELDYLSKGEIKERVMKRHELIKKMSDKEFNILISRPGIAQGKIKYNNIRYGINKKTNN